MPDYAADTEFNEALRKHGIIPALPSTASRSPSPILAPASPSWSDLSDLSLTADDALPRSVLEAYRESRLKEERLGEGKRKFGRVYAIGKGDWDKEVNECSAQDLEGEPQDSGTGVVVYLFKDYLLHCKLLAPLLSRLAALYPSTKFVSIISDHCIDAYPDKNCPTLICYRKGDMTGQVVGLGGMGGEKVQLSDVERMLFAFRALDFHLKVESSSAAQFSSKSAGTSRAVESDSEDDETFVGGANKSRGIRSGQVGRTAGDDDDEYDL